MTVMVLRTQSQSKMPHTFNVVEQVLQMAETVQERILFFILVRRYRNVRNLKKSVPNLTQTAV